tara:strand:- start:2651 stop:3268 length:618 start_codon:yes stop_codon:yes gene_type:complete
MNKFEFNFKNDSVEEINRFVYEVLDRIDASSGSRRKKMYKKGRGEPEPKNTYSITYGYVNLGYLSPTKQRERVEGHKNLFKTKLLSEHPELKSIIQEFCDIHCKEGIVVDQIQINKNWWSPPHYDSGNVGESYIVGLGDYTGGETVVDYGDHIEKYDIKNKFVKFDGSKYEHWTNKFEGNRYSLVFYTHKLSKLNSNVEYIKPEP